MIRIHNARGFTMVELVVIIVVIGIIMAIVSSRMIGKIENARYETAMAEMEQLARAVAGNPGLYTEGARPDFGYIGDIGVAPDSIGDLVANYHGSVLWNGPYLDANSMGNYNLDPWGAPYIMNDSAIMSIGSGDTITRQLAPSRIDLFGNNLRGFIKDANGDLPGEMFRDSLVMILSYPDGAGAIQYVQINPDRKGMFEFNNIPIGNHKLMAIYTPDSDTSEYLISLNPGNDIELNLTFPADLW